MEGRAGRPLQRRGGSGVLRRGPRGLNARTLVVLVRHGETDWNAEGRIQGHGGTGLSAAGADQARRTAEHLRRRYAHSRAVRSDLQRVAETAAPWQELAGASVAVDPRLRERDFGKWSGLTWAEVEQREPGARARWRAGPDFATGGGETSEQLRRRVWAALCDLSEGNEPVLVFTHGGSVRAAVAAAMDLPPLGERRLGAVSNCSLTELLFTRKGVRLLGYNNAAHLEA